LFRRSVITDTPFDQRLIRRGDIHFSFGCASACFSLGGLAKESSLTSAGKQLFLRITGLFETAVWLLSRIAQLQRQTLLIDEDYENRFGVFIIEE